LTAIDFDPLNCFFDRQPLVATVALILFCCNRRKHLRRRGVVWVFVFGVDRN